MDYEQRKLEYRREVGARLKAAREAAGMTQEEAAAKLGKALQKDIPSSRIGNYEQGTRLPDPIVIQILSDIYGTQAASAIAGFRDAPGSPEETALLEKYRQTDDRGRRAIHSVADTQSAYQVTPPPHQKAG